MFRVRYRPQYRLPWIAALVGTLTIAGSAAANIAVVSDGAAGGSALIRLRGDIRRGDAAGFETALAAVERVAATRINDVPFVTLELDSPGGDVVEALEIGRAVSRHFVMTLVRPGRECVSACVFALMAGAVHTPEPGASVGLHRPLLVSWSNMSGSAARAKYDGLMNYLRDYFGALGVSPAAFEIMMRTDSYAMRYFSTEELDALGLRGEGPEWGRLFSAKWSAGTAPPTPPAKAIEAVAPKLPPLDPDYRAIVFMPGAIHPGGDPLHGQVIPKTEFFWSSLDDGVLAPDWRAPDIAAFARNLARAVGALLGPYWWLYALIAFEILRARPWPGDPGARRSSSPMPRLTPFAGAAVSPASAPVSPPA
jgi:hypothetical protein